MTQEEISIQERNRLLIGSVLKKRPEKPQKPRTEVLMRKTTNTTKRTKKLSKQ